MSKFFDEDLINVNKNNYIDAIAEKSEKCKYKISNYMAHRYDIAYYTSDYVCLIRNSDRKTLSITSNGDTYLIVDGKSILCR